MAPRDVLRIHDRLTRPPKLKRFICVCADRRLFLRINSRPVWPPHHCLFAVNNDFLDHDSYVELGNLIQLPEEDCIGGEIMGRLGPRQVKEVFEALEEWGTLPPAHIAIVRERWVI